MRAAGAVFLLLTIPFALAAQTSPPRTIGEVTLFGEEQLKVEAATKTEIPISRAPSAVTVVTAKQIQESGARTVPDLLRLVAGVNVRWNPMGQTIDIRGSGENPFSNRVLLLIDGSPYNSGDTGGLSGEDLAGGDLQIYGGSRSTGELSAQFGQRIGRGSILGSVRFLRTMFPQEFWLDDRSKFRASDVFLKGTLGDWQVSGYRHDERLDGFDEGFPPEQGLPPTAAFRSAHPLKQTMNAVTLR